VPLLWARDLPGPRRNPSLHPRTVQERQRDEGARGGGRALLRSLHAPARPAGPSRARL